MLPDNVTDLLADRIRSDVRQIESCLHNLVLKAKLLNRQISMEMAWEVLGHPAIPCSTWPASIPTFR